MVRMDHLRTVASSGSSPRSHPRSLGEMRQNCVPPEIQEFFRRESGYDMHPVDHFHMALIPRFGSTSPYLVSPTHEFGEYGVEHDLSSATRLWKIQVYECEDSHERRPSSSRSRFISRALFFLTRYRLYRSRLA